MSLAIRRDFAIKAILQLYLVVLEGSYVEGISKEGEWGMVKTISLSRYANASNRRNNPYLEKLFLGKPP
ncbi:MAG: hypothetical protein ACYTXA_29115 [Nostoc sp.]